ncbi:MAG: hypothetical protein ACI8PZ_004390 [Myxococcota bacterium]|jgi:hypothetical protein
MAYTVWTYCSYNHGIGSRYVKYGEMRRFCATLTVPPPVENPMPNERFQVRCVLCGTWWTVEREQLLSPLRCDKCGAAFCAGGEPADHSEPLPKARTLRVGPGPAEAPHLVPSR